MDFQEADGSAKLTTSGFTLIEVVVVIGITAFLTAMSLAYTRSSEKRIALMTEQAKVVGVLERAKSLTVQKYSQQGAEPVCGYGVFFQRNLPNPDSIVIFQDLDSGSNPDFCQSDHAYDPNTERIEEIKLDQRIIFDSGGFSLFKNDKPIVFLAPYLETPNWGTIALAVRDNTQIKAVVKVSPGGGVGTR